jgi:hypothetical protein
MGEYARSLAIATAVVERWPQCEIHFVLSSAAPYAAATPFPKTLLPSSPTFHSDEVIRAIREFRSDVIIFDNAGRTRQLRAAHASGARIVYISSRPRQRRRAFRLRWMPRIDEHWIAYPEFIAGSLTKLERLKLWIFNRPVVRYLDTLVPPENPVLSQALLSRFALQAGTYVLVVPGGGTGHPGKENAPDIVADGAARIALHGHPTIVVGVPTPEPSTPTHRLLQYTPRLPMTELAELIRAASLVISNGGDTLLQVLACGRPCVAVAIAGDQAHRIEKCVQKGLALRAALDAGELATISLALLDDEAKLTALAVRAGRSGVNNGLEIALAAIEKLSA